MVKYSEDHEWVKLEGDVVTVGITDFAQNELGDIVFVELPEPGSCVCRRGYGDSGSFKAASSVYAPLLVKSLKSMTRLKLTRRWSIRPISDGWFVK